MWDYLKSDGRTVRRVANMARVRPGDIILLFVSRGKKGIVGVGRATGAADPVQFFANAVQAQSNLWVRHDLENRVVDFVGGRRIGGEVSTDADCFELCGVGRLIDGLGDRHHRHPVPSASVRTHPGV